MSEDKIKVMKEIKEENLELDDYNKSVDEIKDYIKRLKKINKKKKKLKKLEKEKKYLIKKYGKEVK